MNYDPFRVTYEQESWVRTFVKSFLTAATKLGQGNIFTGVCLSTGGGGGLPQCMLGYTSPGPDPPDQTPPEQIPREQTPPRKQTPAYGQRAAGTHPTGMHSCLKFLFC